MKRNVIVFFLTTLLIHSYAQDGYQRIPIVHDTAVQWTAESDKVINLSYPGKSLKTWYLDKLKKGTVITYTKERGSKSVSTDEITMPSLSKPDWQKGLAVETSPYRHPTEWYFADNSKEGYERFKYRGGVLTFTADSCCQCDDADAFRAKQILNYKNGKFTIWNVFISPLCARPTPSPPFEWYPLCNVAYNNSPDRKIPQPGNDVILLNTDEVDYDFSHEQPSTYDTVLTSNGTDIGSLIYQDILKGNIRPVEAETGQPIPVKDLLTRGMPADTVSVPDPDDPYKVTAYKVLQQERSSRDFNRIRIKQDLYFDFKNERLYSVVRSVILLQVARLPNGIIRGQYAFCRLE
ncbi:MAG: hypothetical protein HZB42_00800 [Sphingobacteriales bacterium]|nr:hypothetical protein [Sphingobacteriales bacterium]